MSFEFNRSTENVYCLIELLPHNESLPPAPVQEVTSLDLSMADYPPPNETPNQSGLFTSTQVIDPSRLQNTFINFKFRRLVWIQLFEITVRSLRTHRGEESSLGVLLKALL